ncbi:MAG: succinylglutamate desuccinylase [Porticoccus sp.]|nr:succinylglutamate desuccinylase [Porticoccus sp.]MBQ0806559.1 succinylglutamate desuccinylase [Porticoccus sp.]
MLQDTVFRHWYNPTPEQIASTVPAFLAELGGPTIIHLNGRDNSRCRVMVTLLHGNEPSGLKAIHQLLRLGCQPEVTLLLAVVYVDAALAEPLFSHRFLPGQQDMNRLFTPPFEGCQGAVAKALLEIIREAHPEAVIDIHNTSGEGPAFTVCVEPHTRYLDLATLFTHRLIITGHRLGALMEVSDLGCPVLTVECGGSMQVQSDEVAYQGLTRFITRPQLYTSVALEEMDIYHHPVRLELNEGGQLCYDHEPRLNMDITLPDHIDRRNFGVVRPDTALAWLGPRGIRVLRALDERGEDVIDDLFVEEGGKLYPRTTLKLFMATTNPDIAISDCLLYAVKETDHDWEATADDEADWK